MYILIFSTSKFSFIHSAAFTGYALSFTYSSSILSLNLYREAPITITDIIHEINPNILKKVIVVSNSKDNSIRLADGLKFAENSEVQTFGIEEFK